MKRSNWFAAVLTTAALCACSTGMPRRDAGGLAARSTAEADGDYDAQMRRFAQATNALALVQAQHGNDAAAERLLRQALDRAPNAAYLYNNLGFLLMRRGALEEARVALERACALDPSDLHARANRDALTARLARASSDRAPAVAASAQDRETLAVRRVAPSLRLQQVATGVYEILDTGATSTRQTPPVDLSAAVPARAAVAASLEVDNGVGQAGLARRVAQVLRARAGVRITHLGNHTPFGTPTTQIAYRPGMHRQALALRAWVRADAPLVERHDLRPGTDLRLLLGRDLHSALLGERVAMAGSARRGERP